MGKQEASGNTFWPACQASIYGKEQLAARKLRNIMDPPDTSESDLGLFGRWVVAKQVLRIEGT